MTPLPPPTKNYQVPHSSTKQIHQQAPTNFRSSVSSHSDIFNKTEEQKLNFGNSYSMKSHMSESINKIKKTNF